MNIVKSFEAAFKRAKEKNWDYIYVLVDIHGTIFHPSYYNKEAYQYYPWAQEALQMLTADSRIKLILWSSSYQEEAGFYIMHMQKDSIKFDYYNENPEVTNTDLQCFDSKLYFNVGIDDKFGFEPLEDWKLIFDYLRQNHE